MSCVWMLQRGHSGDGCVLALTLCKYDLRKGFVCSELGKGATSEAGKSLCVYSILLLSLVARCIETINVCIWRMFVFMSVVVAVGVMWEVYCVAIVVRNSVF